MDSSVTIPGETGDIYKPPPRAQRKAWIKQRKEFHTLTPITFEELVRKKILPNEYQHPPLNPEENLIRLLRLHQGREEETIKCSFLVVSLADGAKRPEYEALSYYWGTDEPSNEIWIRYDPDSDTRVLREKRTVRNVGNLVKPQRFNIRDNLLAALRQFRSEVEDIYPWVDALCIDQDNEEEKTEQVSKMAKIYSMAYHVLVWLGAGSPICEEAMDFISEVIELSTLDNLVKDENSPAKWNALVELLHCHWFSRRWVVQELALAQDATLHYSSKSIYWTDFADAVALFVDRIDEIKGLFRMSRYFNNDPEYLGDVMALGANILVDVTRNSFRKRKLRNENLYQKPLSSLEALMSNLLGFEASDPRDTVYALLSIVKDNVSGHPDYSQGAPDTLPMIRADYTKSAIEVYRDFTEFCVRQSNSVDIICRHWAPVGRRRSAVLTPVQMKRKKKPGHNVLANIPSWVPVLTGSPFGDPEDALNGRSNGDSLVGHPDRKRYNASRGTFPVVRFEDVPLQEPSEEPPSPLRESAFHDGIAHSSMEKSNVNRAFFMYVKGFEVDSIAKVSSRIAGGLLIRECLTMGDWNEPDDLSTNDVPDKLWRTLVADRGPNGDNPPTWYQRACSESFAASTTSGDIDTGALIANPRSPSHMVQFLKRVQSIVWNRVFVTTQHKEHFGLAPKGTRGGDLLCILLGCSVPVILRESKSERGELKEYQLIGETYIYGLMDGEALETAAYSSFKDFKLG
ncbi:MAG: hypothetical protein Q9201_003998 [Fulgogasparrea decipioides]